MAAGLSARARATLGLPRSQTLSAAGAQTRAPSPGPRLAHWRRLAVPDGGAERAARWAGAGDGMSSDRGIAIASLNLHGGRRDDGTPFDVEEACRTLPADIVALQEVWRPASGPDPLTGAAAALGARAITADLLDRTSLRELTIAADTAPGSWGLAVLTTLPVTSYELVDLGRARGDVARRAAQLVTVSVGGGRRLRIANAHLTHRFASPLQLLGLVRRLRADEEPTVIVGDLNMPFPVTGLAAGHSPAVRGKTFPARRPVVQLDHILTGRGAAARGGQVLPAAGSDHLPVCARVVLSGRRACRATART